jgi:flagellar basal body L-ring protein FlgH
MGNDTTTIEITEGQKAELEARKNADRESMKSVLERVLSENPHGELGEQLDRIESAAREATNAAQNAEQAIEEATQ